MPSDGLPIRLRIASRTLARLFACDLSHYWRWSCTLRATYAIPVPRFLQSDTICAFSTSLPPNRSSAKVPANSVPMNGCSAEFPFGRIQPQTSICPSSCWAALKSRKAGLFRSRRTERMPFSTTVISEPVRAYGMGDLYCVVAQPTNRTDKAATARVRGLVIGLEGRG